MFLVNVPPLVAFQTKWAQFGQTATCKLPECFSESEEDISGTPISAKVQGIINKLQTDESSLDVNSEYECIMQKNRKGELNTDKGLRNTATAIKGHARESATLVVPAEFEDCKDDNTTFEPLTLESDSDDSVDRDIEEAIQEYLKNKSTGDSSHLLHSKSSTTIQPDEDLQKHGHVKALTSTCPVKMVTVNNICDGFKQQDKPRCASPDSVSSDDSFEQSIKDEIEQFLNEKKQQNNASQLDTVKKNNQTEKTVKPKLKSNKTPEKQNPKQENKELFVKKPPDSVNLQLPKCPKPSSLGFKNISCKIEPKGFISKQNTKQVQLQEPIKIAKEELSDSSSDDGIEEAIQLYQLEKSRQESNLKIASAVSPELVKSTVVSAVNVSHCLEKSTPPGLHKKSESRKRQLFMSKPVACQDIPNCQPPTSKKAFSFVHDSYPKCETGIQASYRAETAAELMCAEAILDISKTILPAQPENTFAVPVENTSSHTEPYSDSDSSVDSDDSIEQEIRTFLARKAQEESICTTAVKQEPSSTESRPEQGNRSPFSKSKLSLTNRRKLKENKTMQQDLLKNNHFENVESAAQSNAQLNKYLQPNEQFQNSSVSVDDGAKLQHTSEMNVRSRHSVVDAERYKESSPIISRGHRKSHESSKSHCSGDKSSSLDSDEDLDTAIKDLLRSKRKLKKRSKDPRPQCKKRVRFGETTAKPLEIFESTEQVDSHIKAPSLIRSCLLNSTNTKENSLKKVKSNVKRKEEKLGLIGNSNIVVPSPVNKDCELKTACASDKTGTNVKPCAFSEAHDSSSVDSDDSIEQEIRKFLAERARESAELTAAQKATASVSDPNLIKVNNAQPFKQDHKVLLNPVTETVLQPAEVKNISVTSTTPAAVVNQLYDCKQSISHIGQLYHHPVDVSKVIKPINRQNCLIIKKECFVDQNSVVKPRETCLQATPGRVVMKTEVNSPQGKLHLPVSGNFIAGLKYVSGNEKQLVLNTGPSRIVTDLCKTGGEIARLGSYQTVQKKGPVLEKCKDVQTPNILTKNPLVRPGLYLVTTKICKENSPSLVLPINTTAYETGINLMSIQYCCSQVNSQNSTYRGELPLQHLKSGETRESGPSKAGEVPSLDTKTSVIKAAREALENESRTSNLNETAEEDLETGSGRIMKENKSTQEGGNV
ncbi:protein phosphatase 1 regulatory subunit 26 [Rhinophrynus dorsalis]